MKVIGLVSRKGGSGKSTLAFHWAVEACSKGLRTVLIDMDPQGSSTRWYKRRKQDDVLLLQAKANELTTKLSLCRAEGIDLVIIDTTPDVDLEALEAVALADLVVVPCRPSALDLEAVAATVGIIRHKKARAVFAINAVDGRTRDFDEAHKALLPYQLPICPHPFAQRAAYRRCVLDGRTAPELPRTEKASREVSLSWSWINTHLQEAA